MTGVPGCPMELYLMQHGANLSSDIDPAKPLSPVGIDVSAKAARMLKSLGAVPGLIATSPKLRARQTATVVARELGYPESAIEVLEALSPSAKPETTFESLRRRADVSPALVIGHMPHLAHFINLLACPQGGVNLVLEHGSLTRLDIPHVLPGKGRIVLHLRPAIYTLLR